jgi:hypothetical protein
MKFNIREGMEAIELDLRRRKEDYRGDRRRGRAEWKMTRLIAIEMGTDKCLKRLILCQFD